MSPSGLNFGPLSPLPLYEKKLSIKNKLLRGMVKGVLVKTSAQCSCVGRTSLIALSFCCPFSILSSFVLP